jgi:hypothetical protein
MIRQCQPNRSAYLAQSDDGYFDRHFISLSAIQKVDKRDGISIDVIRGLECDQQGVVGGMGIVVPAD